MNRKVQGGLEYQSEEENEPDDTDQKTLRCSEKTGVLTS